MAAIRELQADELYRSCKPEDFKFETTGELNGSPDIPGQARATEAVQFGLGVEHDGYNIFALGPAGTGKKFLVEGFLKQRAETRPVPPDLCYVNNFAEPNKPALLVLPPGLGACLKKDLKELIEEIFSALPGVFE